MSSQADLDSPVGADAEKPPEPEAPADLLERVNDAFFALDREWRFTYLNAQAETTLRRAREELLGKNLWNEFPKAVGTTFQARYEEAMTEQRPVAFSAYFPPLDLWTEVRAYPSDSGLSVYFVDAGPRRRQEEELRLSRGREKFLAALLDRSAQALAAGTVDGRLITFNKAFEHLTGYSAAELRDEVNWLDLTPPEWVQPEKRRLEELVRSGHTQIYEKEYRRKDGSRVPIELVVDVYRDGEREILYSFISDISERKRTEEALRAEHEFSTAVLDSAGALLLVLDEEGCIVAFNRTAEEKTGYSAEEVRGRTVFDLFIPEEEREGVTRTFRELLDAGGDFESEYENHLLDRNGDRFLVSWRNTALRKPDGSLRYIVATGVDVTLERRREQLNEALNHLNLELGSLDPDEILQNLVIEGGKALGSSLALVTMREEEGWLIRYAAGQDESLIGRLLEVDEAPISVRAELERRPLAISDVREVPYAASSFAHKIGLRAVLAAPFFRRGALTGLVLFYFPGPRQFSEPEIDFSEKLAASVSLALENARLYQAQVRIAQNLQESLLTVPEKIKGVRFAHLYRSATHAARVGGDFYDLFSVDEGQVGVVIGDVSGHGVEAAALASLVKDTIRAYAYQRSSPEAVLHLTNEALIRRTDFHKFVTVFFGLLDVEAGSLAYSSAGHPPALLLRGGQRLDRLESTAPPLGSFADSTYSTQKTDLEPGELLLLYTDGVIEARSEGRLFGEQRLAEFLKSRKDEETRRLPGILFREVRTFADGTLNDDVALLLLELEEPGRVT